MRSDQRSARPWSASAGKRPPVAALVLAVVLSALTACTAGRATTGTASRSTTDTADVTAAGTAEPPTAGPPGTGASGTIGTATSGAGLPGDGTSGTVTSGPSGDQPTGTAAPEGLGKAEFGSDDPAENALEQAFPGLYGLMNIGGSITGKTLTISSPGDCGFVLDVLRAGQWSMTVIASPHDDSHDYAAIMTLGDRVAVLNLDDSADACAGTMVAERPVTIAVGGAGTSGEAAFLPLNCLPVVDSDTDAPASHTVIGVYRTKDAGYLLLAEVPAAKGKHSLDPDQDQSILLARLDSTKPAYSQLSKLLTVLYDPMSPSAGEDAGTELASFQGWSSEGGDTADGTASVTVDSEKPFAGTVTAKKLADPERPASTISVTLGFACDT